MKVLSGNDQIAALMQEMRALKQRSNMPINDFKPMESIGVGLTPSASVSPTDFGNAMKSALDKANEVMLEASELKTAHDLGDPSVDLTRALIASRKAEVAFAATVQVRNKLVDAYKDIMNMQI